IGVSGEFRYFGPAFSSVARVRPVKAMTLPASLAMGNMTRLRNLEYMAAAVGRGSVAGRWSLVVGSAEASVPLSGRATSKSPPKRSLDGAPADARSLASARD